LDADVEDAAVDGEPAFAAPRDESAAEVVGVESPVAFEQRFGEREQQRAVVGPRARRDFAVAARVPRRRRRLDFLERGHVAGLLELVRDTEGVADQRTDDAPFDPFASGRHAPDRSPRGAAALRAR
jgi:hypothetical protein